MFFDFNFKSLVYLLPAGVSAYKLTQPIKKSERNLYLAIGGASVGAFIYSNSKDNQDLIFPDVPTLPTYNSQVVTSILSDLSSTLLTRLFDATPRCTALQRYHNTTENDFKVIANKFKSLNQVTIRYAINDINTDGCGIFETEWSDKVIERLDFFNIP